MNTIVGSEKANMLWDADGHISLLTPWGEFYKYSETELGLYCFSRSVTAKLAEYQGVRCNGDDYEFTHFFVPVSLLAQLLTDFGSYKRRPDAAGGPLQSIQEKLAHRLRPASRRIECKSL